MLSVPASSEWTHSRMQTVWISYGPVSPHSAYDRFWALSQKALYMWKANTFPRFNLILWSMSFPYTENGNSIQWHSLNAMAVLSSKCSFRVIVWLTSYTWQDYTTSFQDVNLIQQLKGWGAGLQLDLSLMLWNWICVGCSRTQSYYVSVVVLGKVKLTQAWQGTCFVHLCDFPLLFPPHWSE